MSSMAATAGPYSAQLVTLYALLIADVVINATADANAEPLSRFSAISYLVIQLVVRVLCVFNTIGLLGSSGTWYDEVLLRYCGVFVVSLSGLIICLFLRVYRVTLVAFPSRFPTVLEYFADLPYVLLLVGHTMASLLFYYCARGCLSMHGLHTHAPNKRLQALCSHTRCLFVVTLVCMHRLHLGGALDGRGVANLAAWRATRRRGRRAADDIRGGADCEPVEASVASGFLLTRSGERRP